MKTHYPVPTRPNSELKSFLPLTLIEVSHAKKLELLERSSAASQEALPQTQDMLARLREFQPSIAQIFQIKDISISQAPLRLLCESSEQLQLDSPKVGSYIALSYCWHGPDWTVAECLGRPEMGWPIATTMVHGLLNQRESSDEGVWIDQCCINQGDPLDKQLIIGSMDLIYRSARKVVVLLEDVMISRAEEVLLQEVRVLWNPQKEDLDVLARILIRILSARWFQRAWCSHELQLSNDLVFLLPTENNTAELSTDNVEKLFSVTAEYVERDEELYLIMMEGTFRSYGFFNRTLERKIGKVRGRSLISGFSDICQLACSVQSDILCIAINVSGLQAYFTGQIRSPNECRWVMAMVALSAGDAVVLGGIDEVLKVEDRPGTPSWLNWVNDLDDTMTRVGYSKLQEPTGIKSIDQYQITLDVLDLSYSDFRLPSKQCFRRAHLLVSLLSEAFINDIENQPYWMSPALDSEIAFHGRSLTVEILACSLECGFEWMTKQMSSAPKLVEHVQKHMGDFESTFWLMLEESVLIENSPELSYLDQLDNNKKDLVLLYLYFVLFVRVFDYGRTLSQGETARASPGEHNEGPVQEDDRTLTQCMCLDIGSGNKALVAVSSGIVEQGVPSIPVALSNGSCAGIRRLWFIDSSPNDEDNVKILIGKYYMFTLMPIEENAIVIKRRNQIVRQRM